MYWQYVQEFTPGVCPAIRCESGDSAVNDTYAPTTDLGRTAVKILPEPRTLPGPTAVECA
jgi:hypothetical protein